VVGYGAAAKATTLLNYCGIRSDLVEYVVDRSPHKQGRFLPGSHLAIHDPAQVDVTRPDYLLLFAWNLKDEIVEQMQRVREFGCRFVVPIPQVEIFD
jgi:C-methyltransferase-like protein